MKHTTLVTLFVILLFVIGCIVLIPQNASAPVVVPLIEIPKPQEVVLAQASKDDLISVDSPRIKEKVSSPFTISGKARGSWFFEGSFPVILTDWDGKIIAKGIAKAQGEWMTTEYVPFTATLTYTLPAGTLYTRGTLILKKDNPSDNRKLDNTLEYEVEL